MATPRPRSHEREADHDKSGCSRLVELHGSISNKRGISSKTEGNQFPGTILLKHRARQNYDRSDKRQQRCLHFHSKYVRDTTTFRRDCTRCVYLKCNFFWTFSNLPSSYELRLGLRVISGVYTQNTLFKSDHHTVTCPTNIFKYRLRDLFSSLDQFLVNDINLTRLTHNSPKYLE